MARFDAVASRYDRFCETPIGQYVDQVERALLEPLLAPRRGEAWIDLGSGTGAFAIDLAHRGIRVTAVDESSAMLREAEQKLVSGDAVRLVKADLRSLPFPDDCFDAGLLQLTLEFVHDPIWVLREARRVIRVGGRLIIGLIHALGPWAAHYRERAGREPDSVWRGARFWTLPEIQLAMGLWPSDVRWGLFVGPRRFTTLEQALAEERSRSVSEHGGPLDEAGYLAVRFDL